MLIPVFEQAGESDPKHYSCQLWLDWHQIDIVQGAAPTFWYNCTNDGKGDKFGTNEVVRISICLFHTYIHFYLLRQDNVQLKNLKGDVDLPN